MARPRKKERPEKVIGSGSGAGTDSAMPTTPGSISGALKGPYANPDLVYQDVPGFVTSPFGINYQTKRSRPIADDAVQFMVQEWRYDIMGVWEKGTPTGTPGNYDLPDAILENWYLYYRRALEALNKHRASDATMTDPTIFKVYWNVYHDVVANLVLIMSLARLRSYSEGMVYLTTNLTDSIVSRAISLWRRASAVRAPAVLKAIAIRDGMPLSGPYDRCVTARSWRLDLQDTTTLVPPTAFTAFTGSTTNPMGVSATAPTDFLDNIDIGVQILEGLSGDSTDQADLNKMLDLIHMGSYFNSTKDLFVQGLPPEFSMPPLNVSPSAWNDYLYRCLMIYDTKGVSTDQMMAFPSVDDATLNNLIPVCGKGTPTFEDFTLFGAVKAATTNSNDEQYYADTGGAIHMLGQTFPTIYTDDGTNLENAFKPSVFNYSREDGEEGNALMGTVDFGDGASIRGFDRYPSFVRLHKHYHLRFAAQLAANWELNHMDRMEADYSMYIPASDLLLFHATMLSQIFGVPALVSG